MPYQVIVLKRAETELQAAADWIAERSPQSAERWFNGFVRSLLSLQENPQRCALAPESESSLYELRQLIYRPGKGRAYRAVFLIADQQVRVLRIRGAGEDLMEPDELA